MKRVQAFMRQHPWSWSFLAAFTTWAVTAAYISGTGGLALASTALSFSTFFVMVGIGQMFVITLGPGNVDLSIPSTITLSAVVSMMVMDGSNTLIVLGVLAAVGVGLLVGLFNYSLIRVLSIPPIIATMSSSFLVQSSAIALGRGVKIKPPLALEWISTAKILGVPILALLVIAFAIGMAVVLNRTIYGRSVTAFGQNTRAAKLAGVPIERIRYLTYTLSAVLAAVCGVFLAGFSGGSSLNMGEEYLLASIAVVVIGGSSIAGGNSNVPGIFGSALFLFLLVAMLNTFGAAAGLRLILTGLIIVGVVTFAGGRKESR
ncbi:ABC transporter permease [uncultured Roseibium sp.]|uniref:ABC transporter permease n=1 Tax=uncultured Roseibium sp. TaxID=1936171 RepID=UPI002639F6D1|nr:ABC transporter permease [uncultured Roseibium sp.]